jgi:hypothetical protein
LDCLTVTGAKKSSRALTTWGENRRRSDFASAANLKARLRGNDMVFLTVGSVGMGLVALCVQNFVQMALRGIHKIFGVAGIARNAPM